MAELKEKDIRAFPVQSSKGNQLKWEQAGVWYKADYTGYEGLAEYMVSALLKYSDLKPGEFIPYETEEIFYKKADIWAVKAGIFFPGDGSSSH